MKKFRLWLAMLLTAALSAILFAACAKGVSLDKTELTLKVGQSETLTVSAPEDALLSWSSSDETVATVTDGTVTAVKEGSATVTVRATVGESAYTANCAITVTAADNITVTFVADGTTVDTLEIAYGGSVSAGDIPDVPLKNGFIGTWDKSAEELTNLTANVTVTAQYAKVIDYTVTVYTQQADLTYTAGTPQTLSAAEGTTVTAEPDAAEDGYFLDTEKSVLSATLAEGTELKIYYSLEYNSVYVRRADSASAQYRVYASGKITDTDGEEIEDFNTLFTLTQNTEGHYYFWDIDGVIVKRALEAEDFRDAADGTIILEKFSTDSVYNTAGNLQGVTVNADGTVTFTPTSEWATGVTPGYVYFTGSSDTFYAKVKVTHASASSNVSVGFVLSDAKDPEKNVQFYFNGYGENRELFQNNSWGWEPDCNRTLYSDTLEVFGGESNVLEIVVADGYVWFWLNGSFFCSASIGSLTGFGNVEGLFDDTEIFNLGIAQWRFEKPVVTFSETEFLYGDEAAEKVADRVLKVSFTQESVDIDLGNASTLQLALVSNGGPSIDLSGATFESDNPQVVSVDPATGKLTPVGKGTANITATVTIRGETYTAKCVVTLKTWTVSFVADDQQIGTVTVFNGGGVSSDQVPAVPEKPGQLGAWDKSLSDLSAVRGDITVKAIYSASTMDYTVETYVQQSDLSYLKTDTATRSGVYGSSVSVEPAQAEEGYFLDMEKSVLSATLAEGTVLKVYYSLEYGTVTVQRGGSAVEVLVYTGGIVTDAEGKIIEDYSSFALTEDGEGQYYFWNIGGEIVRRDLTKNDFVTLGSGTIVEQFSTDAMFNSNAMQGVTINADGTVTFAPTSDWVTGVTPGYVYFIGSSDTFYAKVTVTPQSVSSDISVGFVLSDARDPEKNVQLYFNGNGTNRELFQNNSWGWDADRNRTLYSDSAAVFGGESNVLEIVMADGYIWLWLNNNYFCAVSVASLTGLGNEEGLFNETDMFNLGIGQWRFNKPDTTFSEVVFLSGEDADAAIAEKMPVFSLGEGVLEVDPTVADSLKLTLTTNYGSFLNIDSAQIVWESKDTNIVTVENGVLTPVNKGTTKVTATITVNGKQFTAEREISVVAVYAGTYTVERYKQNALTKDYELFDKQENLLAENETVSVTPEEIANYTISDSSVLTAQLEDGTAILKVYYDLIVSSVKVTFLANEESKEYTAYYGIGLYDGETAVEDYGIFATTKDEVWKLDSGYYYGSVFTQAYFASLTTELSAQLCAVSEIGNATVNDADMKNATLNEDGSIDTVSSGWTGAWAYFTGSGTEFYAEARLRSRVQMNGGSADKDISAGFTVRGSDGSSIQFYLSYAYNTIRVNCDHQWAGTETNFGDTSKDNIGSFICSAKLPSENLENGTGSVIGLSYKDGTFTVYVDGAQVFTATMEQLPFGLRPVSMGTGWTVGIASWDSHQANFSDYYVVFGEYNEPAAE